MDRYHHGDLKRALVEAALEMLAEGGTEALGMRELSRRVGVSAAAPYRHFKDKQALIQAVAAAGFERFYEAVERAKENLPEDEQFAAMAEAYVKFRRNWASSRTPSCGGRRTRPTAASRWRRPRKIRPGPVRRRSAPGPSSTASRCCCSTGSCSASRSTMPSRWSGR
jgi:AcrR family transcriptional regulator